MPMTQETALTILKTGANVFLTGEPGSGKSYTVRSYVDYLRSHNIDPAITASTGIAATHIGGQTIHSWSGIGIKNKLTAYDVDAISSREYVAKKIRNTKVLIIDEVSMLSPSVLDAVDLVTRAVKQNDQPFGGMQIVLVGDFFQLPPIKKRETNDEEIQLELMGEKEGTFSYESFVWRNLKILTCYLHEQHRQDDSDFLELLSSIRNNSFDESHFDILKSRQVTLDRTPNNAPKLYSHNINVDRVNEVQLGKIQEELRSFQMSHDGKQALVEGLKKGCLSPESLSLKVGAEVMFTKNNPIAGFVNGTLGKVVSFSPGFNLPMVRTRSGKVIVVEKMDWTIEEDGRIVAKISQLPLRLAWAITVHKSQGMSMDEAVMDLSEVFEYGQGYVALSRVRTLGGLYLLGWNKMALSVHPEILYRDSMFRDDSLNAESAFSDFHDGELLKMWENFIHSIGGRKIAEEKKKVMGNKISRKKKAKASAEVDSAEESPIIKIREKHPQAYMPWSPESDEKLKKMFKNKMALITISRILGRRKGAIEARLIKMGLMEDDGRYSKK